MSYEVEITQDYRGYHARSTGEIRELYQIAILGRLRNANTDAIPVKEPAT